jgi:ABC-type cobalamin/Fe3+-siderophores transport system ATPase subunit
MASFHVEGDFKLPKVPMTTDNELANNLAKPLSSIRSGSMVVICGAAGSGKSSALINIFIMHRCPKTKQKRNLKKCFHNIFVVSPSMSSFKNNIFEHLIENYRFDNLVDFLDQYEDMIDTDEEETAIIFDDVGAQLRSKDAYARFQKLIHNRRHKHLTIFVLVQNLTMLAPAVRDSMNMLICFKPKTWQEKERVYELAGLPKKHMDDFFTTVFKQKFDSVLVDMSLKNSNDFMFYRNIFNPIHIKTGAESDNN